MDRNAERYFAEDKQYRRPVVTNRYREPIDLFDRHIYEKGSLVLHSLRSVLGDGEFWNVLRTYLERFQQQSVETIDLIRTVESVTGKNMKKFFDQWIFGAGYPEFKVKYAWERDENESGGTAKITVIQQQEEDNTAEVFDLPVEMRFLVEGQQRRERVHLHEREMTFYFPFSVQPEQFHFDPGNWILKQLDLKIPQKMLLSQLHSADGAMMRIQAARALEDEPTARVVDALADRLHRDTFWGVRAEIAKTLGKMKTDRALDALIGGLESEHPKVRRAVVEALGEFHEEKAARALEPYAHEDPSYFVEASANKALGKMRMAWTAELLRNSLQKESFNEVIRGGALAGLAHLDQEEVIDSLLKYIEWGKPQLARAAAAVALGNTHFQHRRIRNHLLELLSPREHFRVKFGAITGLQRLNDTATVPELKSFAGREPQAILQRLAMIAARTIQQRQGESRAMRDLREEVDRIRSERRDLISRIEKLESGINRS